jgi:hypothetical protein
MAQREFDDYRAPGSAPQQQAAAAPARWSHHLEKDPYGGAAGQWAKKYYDDPNADPNAAIQKEIGAFRSKYGSNAPADDRSVIEMIATGKAPSARDQALSQVQNTYSGGGNVRDILKQQLEAMSKPPDVNDPGIREVLAGQRLSSQRGAERQRAMAAERLAQGGLADSGASETARQGIEQARGEADARFTGDLLGGELDARRKALMNLLGMGFQDEHFLDQMGFNYAGLEQNSNLQALMALLGAG